MVETNLRDDRVCTCVLVSLCVGRVCFMCRKNKEER